MCNWNEDYKNTQGEYESRIEGVHSISKEVQKISSELEKEEAALLKELEFTQGNEFELVEKLRELD